MRQCTECGETKPLSEFWRRSSEASFGSPISGIAPQVAAEVIRATMRGQYNKNLGTQPSKGVR